MKNRKFIYLKTALLLGFIFTVTTSCEREPSDDIEFATFSNNAEVFIDGFSGGLEYLPFGGSKLDAFSLDDEVSYEGEASMRFDVPNFGDPDGAFAGAIFPDAGSRDLSGYDALTFWAKASQAGTINEIGFGNDFGENKFLVTRNNLRISTSWTKYIIPIPDPFKLTLEKGMFWYAEGPEDNNGYTFWIDELKYEKLGTVAQPRPAIFNEEDIVRQAFNDSNIDLTGLTQTFNLESGLNETVTVAPSYFTFNSTDNDVARVSELGKVSVVGAGTTEITATMAGVKAKGSLTITSSGDITSAPIPQFPASEVISLFSNQYPNVPVDTFRADFGNTDISDITVDADDFKFYTNLDFVGIQFQNPTIDATGKNSLFLDIFTNSATAVNFQIQIRDRGANGQLDTDIFTGNPTEDDAEVRLDLLPGDIPVGEWITIEIPLTGNLTNQKNNLAQIVFVGDIDFVLDNLYFR